MDDQNKAASYFTLLGIGLLATFLPVFWIEYGLMKATGGVVMYPLDDTFIHMELAQNLTFHQTWGINPGHFSSASSSPLYTLVLALCFRIFSAHTAIPLIVNCGAAVALLAIMAKWLQGWRTSFFIKVAVLLSIIVLTPLPILVVSGMEHTLQCLFVLLFLRRLLYLLDSEPAPAFDPTLALYAALLTSTRYEGLFMVAAAGLVLLLQRRFTLAVVTGFASLVPVAIFGAWSMAKGGYFLPNSVLIKGESVPLSIGGLLRFVSAVLIDKLTVSKNITSLATQRLLLLLPLTVLLFRKNLPRTWMAGLSVIFLATVLHLAFASTGWFYRYEAYLVMSALLLCLWIVVHHWESWSSFRSPVVAVSMLLVLFFLEFPFVLRSSAAFTKAKRAGVNIYEQQYQMAQFLRASPGITAVAANDIGAISFYTATPIIDLWGLGNNAFARSRKEGRWTPHFIDTEARKQGARFAIVYDEWFTPELLGRWQKVGEWKVTDNVILGGDTVSFYALSAMDAPLLRNALQAFGPKLPSTVAVNYY